jgi:hypothetical protein
VRIELNEKKMRKKKKKKKMQHSFQAMVRQHGESDACGENNHCNTLYITRGVGQFAGKARFVI